MSVDHGTKVRILVGLCRELTALGLYAVMSDARPALSVRSGGASPSLWISVSPRGTFFEWHSSMGDPLAATDPQGAARRIADYLRATAVN